MYVTHAIIRNADIRLYIASVRIYTYTRMMCLVTMVTAKKAKTTVGKSFLHGFKLIFQPMIALRSPY